MNKNHKTNYVLVSMTFYQQHHHPLDLPPYIYIVTYILCHVWNSYLHGQIQWL